MSNKRQITNKDAAAAKELTLLCNSTDDFPPFTMSSLICFTPGRSANMMRVSMSLRIASITLATFNFSVSALAANCASSLVTIPILLADNAWYDRSGSFFWFNLKSENVFRGKDCWTSHEIRRPKCCLYFSFAWPFNN